MEINLDNYEMYFLLWIDNELSSEEKDAVELFIEQYPYLAEELQLFENTKLFGEDDVQLETKVTLLKSSTTEINSLNEEAYLLLYIDNELCETDKVKLEKYISQHTEAAVKLQLLKEIKLYPEEIVFDQKQTLYRNESTHKIILFLWFKKMAVAAIFVCCIVMAWLLMPKEKQSATNHNIAKIKHNTQLPYNNDISKLSTKHAVIAHTNTDHLKTMISHQHSRIDGIEKAIMEDNVEKTFTLSTEGIAKIQLEKLTTLIITKELHELPLATSNSIELHSEAIPVSGLSNEKEVYKELDTDEREKNIYIGSMVINKDKFRGVVRKAVTIFKSRSRQEDEVVSGNK